MEIKKRFKNIPIWTDLEKNMNAYTDDVFDELKLAISKSFKDLKNKIDPLMLTFLPIFINKQASLYTNQFVREGLEDVNFIDVDSLNEENKYVERFYHLSKYAGLYLYGDDNKVKFKALNPLDFFSQKGYTFIQADDENVILFIEINNTLELYNIKSTDDDKDIFLSQIVNYFDLNKDMENQEELKENYIIEKEETDLATTPFIQIKYRFSNRPSLNNLVRLQERYIVAISWGVFNADPKMVMHLLANTGMDNDQAKIVFKDLGRRDKMTVLEINDELKAFDGGDISVLVNLEKMYTGFIVSACQKNGVDKNAVITQDKTGSDVESGESKKLSLKYINEYRKDFYSDFMKYEREIFEKINKIWGKNLDVGITYQDLQILDSDTERLNYAIKSRDDGFMTQIEAYSYVNKVSLEVAEIKVNETTIPLKEDDVR